MAALKTKENSASVKKFLNSIDDETRRNDCFKIVEIMKEITKQEAKMWGTAIVGFGSYHYKYASGHEGDMCAAGFSPRKQAISLYLCGTLHSDADLLQKLGKYKTGAGCLYVKKLSDINIPILKQLINNSLAYVKSNKQDASG